MLSALLGSIIAGCSVVCLLIAIGISSNAIRTAGNYELTRHEIELLKRAGLDSKSNRSNLQADIDLLPKDLK